MTFAIVLIAHALGSHRVLHSFIDASFSGIPGSYCVQRAKPGHIFGQQGIQMPISAVHFKGGIVSAVFLV